MWFVLLVGVLIFVHELGHFAWAKFFGVRVLTFGIGFGPRVAGFHFRGTDYVIAAIPLGGYVRMLGESPNDRIAPRDEAHSFHHLPLWKRFIIVVAGPVMNVLFPVLLYFVVFLGDERIPGPVVGTVFPGRPAYQRLVAGDRVLAIDDEPVDTFLDITRRVEASSGSTLRFTVARDGGELDVSVTPVRTAVERPLELVDEVGRIGVSPYQPAAIVGVRGPETPASQAGLRTFDRVVRVGATAVDRWRDLELALRGNRGATVPVCYLRPTRVDAALGGLIDMDVFEPRLAQLTPAPGRDDALLRAGIEPAELYVSYVKRGSPEHAMGLLPGDRLVRIDGEPVLSWSAFLETITRGGGRTHSLEWTRGGRDFAADYALAHETGVTRDGQQYDRYAAGMGNWVPMRVPDLVAPPHRFAYAVREALRSTATMVELTFYSIVRLFEGRVSVRSLGGPLTIMEVAGSAARDGTLNYLALMAFISVNLGVINLLPIPMLDGGHLLFFLVEAVARRRVSRRVRQYASLVGFVLLVGIMVLAVRNDIERHWSDDASTWELR